VTYKDRIEVDRQKDGQNPKHARSGLFNPLQFSLTTSRLGTLSIL